MANGFIRPFKSPAGALILFDKKPGGSLCLRVDYWGLNNIMIKNQYLLSLIEKSLDRLAQGKRFTQLDFTNANHWIKIRKGNEWKTVFQTRYGHFEYLIMPFGLSNTQATFQEYVNKILAEKLDIFIIVYLNDILIYTKDVGQPHVEGVHWVLDKLRKYLLFVNLKKCCFHQDEVCFLGHLVSCKSISIEVETIEVVMKWPEQKSVWDIQVFLSFANFYRQFIQDFSKIAASLTLMLKTTGSPDVSRPELGNGNGEVVGFGIGGGLAKKSGKLKDKNLSQSQKLAKSGKSLPKIGNLPNFSATEAGPSFLTPGAREAFNCLQLVFTKTLILQHFDSKCHIWIKTDALGYAINSVLSLLAFGTRPDRVIAKIDLGQWHLVAFFLKKIILAKTRYKTYDVEFLAIVKAFKTLCHYLESCKYEVLIFTNHNNLCRFMDTKSQSSRQVRWAQELSRYHFQIDYCQGKANAAADALLRFF